MDNHENVWNKAIKLKYEKDSGIIEWNFYHYPRELSTLNLKVNKGLFY